MDSRLFAKQILMKTENAADAISKELQDRPTLDPPALIRTLKAHMWREFSLGVLPASKQITLLPPGDVEMKVLLAQQSAEELLHYQVLAELIAELGGDPELTHYEPTEEDIALYNHTYGPDTLLGITGAFQVSGEVILIEVLKSLIRIVDKRMGEVIRDRVLAHEGSHVRNGRLLLERYATTPEGQAAVEASVNAMIELRKKSRREKLYPFSPSPGRGSLVPKAPPAGQGPLFSPL